jgi:hypothetical protein
MHAPFLSAVDPASYQAVVVGTPFPAVPVSAISVASGGPLSPTTTVPVLASPTAAANLGQAAAKITSPYPSGQISVRSSDRWPARPPSRSAALS